MTDEERLLSGKIKKGENGAKADGRVGGGYVVGSLWPCVQCCEWHPRMPGVPAMPASPTLVVTPVT